MFSWPIPLSIIPVVAEALKDEYPESKLRGLFMAAGVAIPSEARTKVELCMGCLALVNQQTDPMSTLAGLIGDLMDRAADADDPVHEHRKRIIAALQNHQFSYSRGGQVSATTTKLLSTALAGSRQVIPLPAGNKATGMKPLSTSEESSALKAHRTKPKMSQVKARSSLFIGSTVEALQIARAVHAELDHDLEVTIWNHGLFQGGTATWAQLLTLTTKFDFALFIFSGDDKVVSRGAESLAVRDNVLIEFGLFVGALGQDRVFFMHNRGARPKVASDLAGITPLTYADRSDNNFQAAVSPAADNIRQAAQRLGPRTR